MENRTKLYVLERLEALIRTMAKPCLAAARMTKRDTSRPQQRVLLSTGSSASDVQSAYPSRVEWLLLLTGLVLVHKYRWVLDDSTVYFRYVDNLLFLGRGLVYNDGEYVEGYSSPAWILLLALLRQTRLDYWTITESVGLVIWVGSWAIAVHVNSALSGHARNRCLNLPLVILATSYGPLSYFTSGSEAPLMQLAAMLTALYSLHPQSRLLQCSLGALPLVRNEFAIPLLIIVLANRLIAHRFPRWLIGSAILCGTGWMIVRLCYYADPFPTPFYLKDKTSIDQGLYYLKNAFAPYGLPALLLAAGAGAVTMRRNKCDPNRRARFFMLLVSLSSIVYVVRVGGDMMHYRLLAFPFCLLALSTGGIAELFCHKLDLLRSQWLRTVTVLSLGAVSFLKYPSFLSEHPFTGREERSIDHGISDAPWHRHHAALAFSEARFSEDRERIAGYKLMAAEHQSIAVEVFCANIFANPKTRYVHGYGLTDPILARTVMPEQRPGHKAGLYHLAVDLASFRSRSSGELNLDLALETHRQVPAWILRNMGTILAIEKRAHNHHRVLENLTLFVSAPARIVP